MEFPEEFPEVEFSLWGEGPAFSGEYKRKGVGPETESSDYVWVSRLLRGIARSGQEASCPLHRSGDLSVLA